MKYFNIFNSYNVLALCNFALGKKAKFPKTSLKSFLSKTSFKKSGTEHSLSAATVGEEGNVCGVVLKLLIRLLFFHKLSAYQICIFVYIQKK